MRDGFSARGQDAPGLAHLYLREEQLRQGYEALLRAGRALARLCDETLGEQNLGAAHHRCLFLIASHPAITMSGLLRALHISKQSLNRVLQDLTERGLIERRSKPSDRRLKLLYLTEAGQALEGKLFALQRERLTQAYLASGGPAVEGFRRVLAQLDGEAKGG